MHGLIRRLRQKKYTRLIDVRVYREAILHNLLEFERKYKIGVAPVLKANAYGHGLVETAQILDREMLPFLCVDSYFEAFILRNEGIHTPILVLGYAPVENILATYLRDTAFALMGMDQVREVATKLDSPRKFHLEIDTGMHRHGILPDELKEAIDLISGNSNIEVEGIFTHFADAETPESSLTATQIERWTESLGLLRQSFPNIKHIHCGGTTGGFYASKLEANAMRLGIGLYGINISQDKLDLRPALEMVSQITSVRTILPHERIGYNGTFETRTPMRVATIPAGYAEGLDRRLSNKGSVLVRGVSCPIIGRVSMNITSIDVSNVPDAKIGDEVMIISKEPDAPNSIQAMAEQCGTIHHELLVYIPAQLHRTAL